MGNKQYLSAAQTMRAEQLKSTQKSLGALCDAATNAAKYQGKYVAALETLMRCLLDCSDEVEQTRVMFSADGEAAIAPTFEVTDRLAQSFAALKASAELTKMKLDFEHLADACTLAKRSSAIAAKQTSKLKECAARCTKHKSRIQKRGDVQCSSSTARRQKSESEKLETQMTELNRADIETMMSLSTWWACKLAALSERIADDMSHLGTATAHFFAPPPPSHEQHRVEAPVVLNGGATRVDAVPHDSFPTAAPALQDAPPTCAESSSCS